MPRDHRPARSVRVLLAGDGAMSGGGLAALLGLVGDMRVVAQVPSGETLVDAALAHRPDVALLDVELPGIDGPDAAGALRRQVPDCRVLLLTTHARPGLLERTLASGAAGLLVKDGPLEDLTTAIRRALTGETVIDPALADANTAHRPSPPAA